MAELKFKDVLDKEFTVYEVSSSGSIGKYENVSLRKVKIRNLLTDEIKEEYHIQNGPMMSFNDKSINSSVAGLNKNGNISIGWGHAVFLSKEKAQELARKIVTTKYQNSIKKIENI